MSFHSSPKKRKLQLDSAQCQNITSSAAGSVSLTNPTQSAASSLASRSSDPNKGLYPRKKKKKAYTSNNNSSDEESNHSHRNYGFKMDQPIKPNEFPNFQPTSSLSISQRDPSSSHTENWNNNSRNSPLKRGKSAKDKSPQKNSLLNYFAQKPKLPSVDFSSTTSSLTYNAGNVQTSNSTSRKSLNIGYDTSPENSPEYKPEVTSLAAEISNCQRKINDTIEISSDDDDDMPDLSFGLLGVDVMKRLDRIEAEALKCRMDGVPDHVLEMIFGHLPLPFLLMKASLVCPRWNDIIQNDKFLSWKKKYHKLKTYPQTVGQEMLRQLKTYAQSCKMNILDKFLLGLVRDAKIFEKNATEDMIPFLQNHPKFDGAKDLVETVYTKEKDRNGYAFVIALTIISETVSDVDEILKLLIHPKSACDINVLLECFYYLATMFSYAMIQFKAAKGLHYRVFYSLYQYENLWFGSSKDMASAFQGGGQQSINRYREAKVRLTNQQMKIVTHQLEEGQIIKIVAFAGTGKTSTLVEYTKARLGQRFLLISFNKSVSDHANKKFPGNVECRTAHSLAYAAVEVKRVYRFARNSMKPKDLESLELVGPTNYAGNKGPNAIELDRYRKAVLNTFENYVNSADDTISLKHVPEFYSSKSNFPVSISSGERLNLVTDATLVWNKMKDPHDFTVKMLHDGYLKLHQLQKPVYAGYNAILIDEAQDCNPAMLNIILSQKVPKIFVGDPNQQIYAFRGAVNALQSINHTHIFYLTESFRFGPEIAYVANTILYELKNVRSQTLVGGNKQSFISKYRTGQLAILSRSNASLFTEAVRMICTRQLRLGEPKNIRGCFNGGTAGLKQLIDIYHLKIRSEEDKSKEETPIKDEFIGRFYSFERLKNYALASEDIELSGKIQLVSKYSHLIPQYVDKICSICKHRMEDANVIFSTVHKAKGMEFDTVMLTDDFTVLGFPYRELPPFDETNQEQENELNILYVAVTRAKKCLLLNAAVYFVMLGAGERYEMPVFRSEVTVKECGSCQETLSEVQKFILVKKELELGNGTLAAVGGPLCQLCSSHEEYLEENINHPDDNNPFNSMIRAMPDVNRTLLANLLYPSDL